ncbi:hypothetical protein [Bradyrhizobium sp. B120]|uniref:hypothetical protein n=1 Tax=Bradyrhizobium sp. B120 TaxID=3410088 RepID=UPI003B97DCDD
MKEMFGWVLVGTLIIFSVTTLLAGTGLGIRLGQDEEVLLVVQVASLLASITAAAVLLALKGPPDRR